MRATRWSAILVVATVRQTAAGFLADQLDRSAQGFLGQRVERAGEDVGRFVGGFG